ncbi:MAG: NADH-quinone oxidoreductase subunit NuoG [Chromatiaceae bacterium]
MTDKITIEIDGRACEAESGEMIIQVADRAGIDIPRFCYHKKLSIAANCRMCLVEVEQGGRPFPKPVPACATPVGSGMKVLTRSPRALEAQKGTMEFLLINHPLDCPICDQGGECELQDVAMGYGGDVSRYSEGKRVVTDEDLGPLIATDMTRCIHCTRCVRFGAEIAGVRELGATGRGEDMRIGTYVEHTVAHELSGNIIDLCPVGALTSKPFRFKARAWELIQRDGIAPHDAVGSNIHLHVRGNRVMRVHPKDNEAVNETWISDRDRFSYEGLSAPDRLLQPLVKRDGEWQPITWQDALILLAERLKAAGADQVGMLMAPASTLEEMYLAQETRQAVLLIGADIRQEQPLLAHRIRKAAMAGAHVAAINPLGLGLTFPASQFVDTPAGMLKDLAAIAKALRKRGAGPIKDLIAGATPDPHHTETAERLRAAGKSGLILLGGLAAAHPDFALLKAFAYLIAEAAGAQVGYLPGAANSVGAHLAGALPHLLPGARPASPAGLDAVAMLEQPRRVYLLWGLEPGHDLVNPSLAASAFGQADFVAACTAFRSPSLEGTAHLMLPVAAFAENSGTYVNAGGTWQGFQGAVAPLGEARPGWKLLRVLGNLLDLPGFDYTDSAQVCDELRALSNGVRVNNKPRGKFQADRRSVADGLIRIGSVPIYAVDPLVRRALALQRTRAANWFRVSLNPEEAKRLGLVEGDGVEVRQNGDLARGQVTLDGAVPAGCVSVPAGVAGSELLGAQIGPMTVRKV